MSSRYAFLLLLCCSLLFTNLLIARSFQKTFGKLHISGRQGRSDRRTTRLRGQINLGEIQFDGNISISPAGGHNPRLHGRGTLILSHAGRICSGVLEGTANSGVLTFSPDKPGPHKLPSIGWLTFTSATEPIELHCKTAELFINGEIIFGANRRGRGPITMKGPLIIDGRRRVVKNDGSISITTLMPRSRIHFTASGSIVMNYLLGQLVGQGCFSYHNLNLHGTTFTITKRGPTLTTTPGTVDLGPNFQIDGNRRTAVQFDLRRATAQFTTPLKVMGLDTALAAVKLVRDGTLMLNAATGKLGALPANNIKVSGRLGAFKAGFQASPVVEGWTFANTYFSGSGTPFTSQGKIRWSDGTACMLELAAAATGTVGTLGGKLTHLKGVPVSTSTFIRQGRRMSGNATFTVAGVGDISMPYSVDDGGAHVRPQQMASSMALHGMPLTNATVSIDKRGIALDGVLTIGNRQINDAIFWVRPGGAVRGFGSMPVGRRLVPMVFFSHGSTLGGIGEIPCSGQLDMKEATGNKKAKPAYATGTLKLSLLGTALTAESNLNVSLTDNATKAGTVTVSSAAPVGSQSRQLINLDTGVGVVQVPQAQGGSGSFSMDILKALGFK